MSLKFCARSAFLASILLTSNAYACDLCSVFSAHERENPKAASFYLGINEQFSVQANVKQDGKHLANNLDQELRSSTTQFIAVYDISDEISLQTSVPLISRRFKRAEGDGIERGSESGIGDVNFLLRAQKTLMQNGDTKFIGSTFIGVKVPTGDSNRIGEEALEAPIPSDEAMTTQPLAPKHEGHDHESLTPSAVHGHDLALGSGSVDFPLGLGLTAERGRSFLRAKANYNLKTEGDFQYKYGNDLMWSLTGGGIFCALHEASISAALNFSGEYKPEDRSNGIKADDTFIDAYYFGPELAFNTESGLNGYFGIDFPLSIDNSGVQAVVSQRFRGGVTLRF